VTERDVKIPILRIVVAALAAEVLGVLALVVLVASFGPPGFAAAQPFAERLGAWVGPISGFVLCVAGGYWVASGAAARHVRNGVAMGAAAVALDVAAAVALGASFELLLVISNAGRLVGAAIGGWLASPRARAAASPGCAPSSFSE
jgi:hypothetical protein